jgi:DNA repair photolyase
VLAHANGCSFSPQCTYCYLKSSFWYLQGSEAFTNVDRMVEEAVRWIGKDGLESHVLNTGNLCDSLVFEEARPLAVRLVDAFRQHAAGRPHTLLLVTKGGIRECRPLLDSSPCRNVVVSFSVTNPDAARRYEGGAASVDERMEAASALLAAGWRVRMRIDPMIAGYDHDGIARALATLPPERVTLGTLRADANLLRVMGNGLFSGLEPPDDPKGLARYPWDVRLGLYRPAVSIFREVCPVALCEESEEVWRTLGLDVESMPCNCGE